MSGRNLILLEDLRSNLTQRIKRSKKPKRKVGKIISKKNSQWQIEEFVGASLPSLSQKKRSGRSTEGDKVASRKIPVRKTEYIDEPIQLVSQPSSPQRLMECNMDLESHHFINTDGNELTHKNRGIGELTGVPVTHKKSMGSQIEGPGIDRPIILEDVILSPPLIITVPYDDGDNGNTDNQMISSNSEFRDAPENTLLYNDRDNEELQSTSSNMEIKDAHEIERDVVADIRNTILSSYEKNMTLVDENARKELIRKILDCIFEEGKLERPDLEQVAEIICSIYHNEDKGMYCNGPTGMLYNAFHRRVRKLRSKGILPKSKRALNTMIRIQEEDDTETFSDGVIESIDYLQEVNIDFDDCIYHWSNSYLYRKSMLKKSTKNIRQILNEWKVLELSMAHMLIGEDFKQTHSEECSESLCSNWASTFNEDIVKKIRNDVKDDSTKRKVTTFSCAEEYTNISLVCCLLAILFPPLQTRKWRPTINDAQKSVVQLALSRDEVSAMVGKRLEFWRKKFMEPSPFIVMLDPDDGPIEFIVTFHNLQFTFKSFVEALDICFKMFVVFNIPFPKESKQFYILLNELFYKIQLDIKKSSKVISLIQKIRWSYNRHVM